MLENIIRKPRELLRTPADQLGKAGRFVVFQIKLWSHCARLLRLNRASQQAGALAYHTIFGLVPLAIVLLLIFQLFPAHEDITEKIKTFTYDQLNLRAIEVPDPENSDQDILLTDYIDQILGRYFKGVNTGSITIISVVIVIWVAIALLSTIEQTFNSIWHVSRGRSLIHRVINYWSILTLGPLLIGVAIFIATQESAFGRIRESILSQTAPTILSYFITVLGLFLLYCVVPNTRVRVRPAIWGAAVSGLVWIVARNLFGWYIATYKPYSTVYGSLALIPMSVLSIHITWLIVLFGVQLTFTTQHLTSLDAEIAAARKREKHFVANDLTAINMMREIAKHFIADNAPVTAEKICSRLDIPPEFGNRVLDRLVDARLVARTDAPNSGFVPLRSPASIRLSEISEAFSHIAFAQSAADDSQILNQLALAQRSAISGTTLAQILPESPAADDAQTHRQGGHLAS